MQEFFFYNPDLSYFLFYLYLILSLVLFIVYVVTDRIWYLKYLVKMWETVYVRTAPTIKKPVRLVNPQMLALWHFQLFLGFVISNIVVFSFVFIHTGPGFINAEGAGPLFAINLGSYLSTLAVNFFLVLFCIVNSEFRYGFRKTGYMINHQEFIVYYIIHVVSFFLFSCTDFISLFTCLEILTFSYFVLLNLSVTKDMYGFVFPKKPTMVRGLQVRLSEASLIYLLPNLLSSVLFLLGIFVIYLQLGALELPRIFLLIKYHSLFFSETSFWLFLGLLLIVSSFCIKLSVAPFHNWIILVYAGARQHTVFFLSTVSKVIYFVFFLKYIFPMLFFFKVFSYIFIFFAVCSLWVGTVHGIFEKRFYRLIGYSGILNIGYCFFVLSVFDFESDVLALYMFFVYCLMSLLLYFCITRCQSLGFGELFRTIDQFKQIPYNNERMSLMMILLVFSIIGIPPLPGFFPKFWIGLKIFASCNVFYFCFFMLFVVISSFFYLRLIAFLNLGNTLEYIKNYFRSLTVSDDRVTTWLFFCLIFILPLCSPLVCDYFLGLLGVLLGVIG